MDTASQWPPQEMVVKAMEEIATSCPKPSVERKVRPQKEEAINCPRCNSSNTKFCYYNNYSLSQPRYFCKTCRRYWTEGGSLRNIPVGGGSRKNKRSSSAKNKLPDLVQNPNKIPQTQDLNLGFAMHQDFKPMNFESGPNKLDLQHPSSLELLTGLTTSIGLNSFMPAATASDPAAVDSSGFPNLQPSLNFSLDGLASNYASFPGVQETNGKLLFPFEDLKQNDAQHSRDQHGYWNGVIGGGSW